MVFVNEWLSGISIVAITAFQTNHQKSPHSVVEKNGGCSNEHAESDERAKLARVSLCVVRICNDLPFLTLEDETLKL
jgi:hypothetical protein